MSGSPSTDAVYADWCGEPLGNPPLSVLLSTVGGERLKDALGAFEGPARRRREGAVSR